MSIRAALYARYSSDLQRDASIEDQLRTCRELAARRGEFDFNDVAASFVAKLAKRAPYLFDGTNDIVPLEEQERLWELGKK